MNNSFDTIAAIATPHGRAGISVIRISGPDARASVQCMIMPRISLMKPNSVQHSWIMDGDEPVDEVLITSFEKPYSYTGEDVVEISCHGNPMITKRILNLFIHHGIRMAEPGEFTLRAFLNGKMDLAQAEAVADLIHAKTEASRRVAAYQLEGRLSGQLTMMREELINACSLLEIELDFSEDDVEFANRQGLDGMLARLKNELEVLLYTYQKGRIAREGIRLVITGTPNVGKSSLLNRLLEKERAIVSEIPGTTRDTIEEEFDLDGWLFHIMDTAGVHDTKNIVEQEGVKRTQSAIKQADVILLVLDASAHLGDEDVRLIQNIGSQKKPVLLILNKCDLPPKAEIADISEKILLTDPIRLSARTGGGFDRLHTALKEVAAADELPQEGDIILTRARHAQAIKQAVRLIKAAQSSLSDNMSQEFIALDLRGALDALGEIIGQTSTDDILNNIFSEFCIGK